MNKCPYCGLEARTDYPVEFRCGSYGNGHRSKECMVLEIGLLKERVERLEEALRRIANTDYRGNRSTESQIAFDALNPTNP